MDASRLLAVAADINTEYRETLSPKLKALIAQYTAARDAPSSDNSEAIHAAVKQLTEDVEHGLFARYPPSKLAVLDAIGADRLVGPGFSKGLAEILSVPGQTTAGIVTALSALMGRSDALQKACSLAQRGLEALGVEPYEIPEGEFEVGLLIPERLVDGQLGKLAAELQNWNRALRVFQEVAGDGERDVKVAKLSSGSFEAFLPFGLVAAQLLSVAIDRAIGWYKQILEIRTLREELAKRGAPVAETTDIRNFEKDLVEKGIKALVSELLKQAPKDPSGRRNELEAHLSVSVRHIVRFVDRGGTIEIDTTVPEEPEEPPSSDDADTQEGSAEKDRQAKDFLSERRAHS
jgi:hypothetical protein